MSCVAYRPHMPGSNWNSSDFPSSRSARPPVCLSFEYNLQCPLLVPHLFPPHHRLFHWLRLLPYLHLPYIQVSDIDLFTDTAAILDYLDLRSIMGWPGGGMSTIPFTRSVLLSALGLILLHEKFLQFDWLRAVVFQLNLKYLHVKITKLLRVVV